MSPPIRPHLADQLDTSNFYPIADDESVLAYNVSTHVGEKTGSAMCCMCTLIKSKNTAHRTVLMPMCETEQGHGPRSCVGERISVCDMNNDYDSCSDEMSRK